MTRARRGLLPSSLPRVTCSYSACASDSGAARRALATGGSSGDGGKSSVEPEPEPAPEPEPEAP
eukprot:5793167-Prymnesium_polylepis.3